MKNIDTQETDYSVSHRVRSKSKIKKPNNFKFSRINKAKGPNYDSHNHSFDNNYIGLGTVHFK